ncbi:MAG: TlpA family protein disulfide reductase [Sphingomonas sp.]
MTRLTAFIAKAAVLLGISAALVGARAPRVGDVAPDFQLTLVDGSKVSLAQLKGDVIVLNFWATWCGPCRQELPTLDAYYEAQRKAGLKVFAVTTENSLPAYQLKKLFAVMHIQPVRRIKGPYQPMEGVPTNFVIGRDGRIRYAKAAAFDLDDLNRVLVPLLREPRPADAVPADAPTAG